jgi:hypothetical protein
MTGKAQNSTVVHLPPDPRKFARSKVSFSGKVVSQDGQPIANCTISDLSIVGAKIDLSDTRPLPEIIYLVDVTNEIGYEAHVAWWRPKMAGLAFQAIHDLGEALPDALQFLNSAVRDSKLQKVEELISQGDGLLEAVHSAGFSKQAYIHARTEALQESTLIESLWRLETENTTLKKLLEDKLPSDN